MVAALYIPGRHSYWHCGPPRNICLCSLNRWTAEAATERKENKYSDIACNYHFFPIAFETFGPLNQVGTDFISALSNHFSSNTDDPRETYFLFHAFLWQSSASMQSASPIHSAILMWKCDVVSRDTPRSWFFSHLHIIANVLENEVSRVTCK